MPIEKDEQGFGDTLLNFNKKIGVDKLANSIAKILGNDDCGCSVRAEQLNKLIPYKKENKDEESNK